LPIAGVRGTDVGCREHFVLHEGLHGGTCHAEASDGVYWDLGSIGPVAGGVHERT
jgi:hypothetical protein